MTTPALCTIRGNFGLARVMGLALGLVTLLTAAPPIKASWSLQANLLAQPGFRNTVFALDTADKYGRNWYALRIPLANGLAYEQLPGMLSLTLDATIDSVFQVHSVLPFRRDLEAWYQDPQGASWFGSPSELDINMPIEGWACWYNSLGFLKAGRFKPELGPSPNSVILGSAAPFQDLVWWQAKYAKVRFDWIISSLNTTLTGTPTTPGGEAAEGTETWSQSHLTNPNQRGRIFDEPQKNLMLHRLSYEADWGWIAVIEQALIGGKTPGIKELNPWIVWHDNFGDGYTKSSTSLELGLRPIRNGLFYAQVDFEDIASPVGETKGETAPTTLGSLVGWKQAWRQDSLLSLWSRLDAVYTDPSFNNHRLPLLKMSARRVYRSNYREQGSVDSAGNPNFADTYIVDYPLGYWRGPDAVDLWFDNGFEFKPLRMGGELELAWLRQGDKELWTPWDSTITDEHALSGIVEREKRVSVSLWKELGPIRLTGGFGLRKIWNENHIPDADRLDLSWSAGVTGSIP